MAKFLLTENSTTPETPPGGVLAFYAKDDSKLYTKDDSGIEQEVGSGSTSSSSAAANLLINGSFAIWQRGTSQTGVSDRSYVADRWYVLAENAAINAARTDGSSQRYAARLTQANATAQRLGLAQIIEGANCRHLRGKKATLSGRARLSASGNARFAILSWTGSEDGDETTDPNPHFSSAAKDIVASWGSTSYTAGGFFASSNLVVEGVGSVACDGTNWEDFSLTTSANMSASMTNVFVVVWSESTLAQNVTLDLEAVQLEKGESANDFQQRSVGEELELCQRYCFAEVCAAYSRLGMGVGQGSDNALVVTSLPVVLRTFPVLATGESLLHLYGTSLIIPTSFEIVHLIGNALTLYATKTGSFSGGTAYQFLLWNTAGLVEFSSEL